MELFSVFLLKVREGNVLIENVNCFVFLFLVMKSGIQFLSFRVYVGRKVIVCFFNWFYDFEEMNVGSGSEIGGEGFNLGLSC